MAAAPPFTSGCGCALGVTVISRHTPLPLPRRGLPDKGKPDGIHNQVLHFPPLSSTSAHKSTLRHICCQGKRKENLRDTICWELEQKEVLEVG